MKNTVQSIIWLLMEVAPLTKKTKLVFGKIQNKAPQILTSENMQHQDIYIE